MALIPPSDTRSTLDRAAWLGDAGPGPQTRLFRRGFQLDRLPDDADLHIFGEGRYHLWVNGAYLGRGPVFRHPFRLYVDHYAVGSLLKVGRNIVAALVHTPGLGMHNHVPSGDPCLACRVELRAAGRAVRHIDIDEQWRVTDQSGWQHPTPRRSWALGGLEEFDVAHAPNGWQSVDYDDSAWRQPHIKPLGAAVRGATILPRPLPDLRYAFKPAVSVVGLEKTACPPRPIEPNDRSDALGRQLLDAGLAPADGEVALEGKLDERGGGVRVTGLTAQRGAALHVDLGCEYVGQPLFEIEADSAGVIDFANSEITDAGRTAWLRKGVSYVDRIHARRGIVRFEPMGLYGFRYLTLMLRGFEGSVAVRRLGARASEPDLPWLGRFTCEDQTLNDLFRLCEHTIRVGTQEGLMDCPTREQAPYVGDGHPVAQWLGLLTGDLRHWQYLTAEQFVRQAPSGLIRSTPFSWRDDALIDYNLIAIIGTRDYLRASGDAATARAAMPAARRVLAWFDAQCNAQGLFARDWRTMRAAGGAHEDVFDPARPQITSMNLFIDHAGMGWHNVGEPGIDRNGLNAAINMLLVVARRALADMEEAVGDAASAAALRGRADALASTAHETFFDAGRGYFLDGIDAGKPLAQLSEQTNIWAINAGCCDADAARTIIRRMLTEGDAQMARSGPYFCLYLLDAMAALGMHREALDLIVRRWKPMLDAGATTAWESFNGDQYDSWCHPWSCVPLAFLLLHVLGLPGSAAEAEATLRPRYDLLAHASGAVNTPRGPIDINWKPAGGAVELTGTLPAGVSADVVGVDGRTIGRVSGSWRLNTAAT